MREIELLMYGQRIRRGSCGLMLPRGSERHCRTSFFA